MNNMILTSDLDVLDTVIHDGSEWVIVGIAENGKWKRTLTLMNIKMDYIDVVSYNMTRFLVVNTNG